MKKLYFLFAFIITLAVSCGGGDDGEGGCRIGGTGYGPSALGLLFLMGLVARRRRAA